MGGVGLAGHWEGVHHWCWGGIVAPAQAPCPTQNTSLEVPDFVCSKAKCPLWSVPPVLEPGADRGTGADGRDRDDGR